ncbi:MAG: peptidoglycan recognition family protein [Candidatus Brocadiaceae bacterium]|jgi:hypothetical protein
MRLFKALLLSLLITGVLGCGSVQRKTPARILVPGPEWGEVEPPAPRVPSRPEPPSLQAKTLVPDRSYPSFRSASRPTRIAGALDAPLKRRWKYIVLHHSATDSGSEQSFDRYHREHNGWRGVGYDFVIGNGKGSPDGLVEVTFRWEKQIDGAHANHGEYNKYGIGICLVGNFERDYPTAAQMESLVGLVNYLQERCDIPTDDIYGHRHVRPGGTRCPGKNFPWYEFLSRLRH